MLIDFHKNQEASQQITAINNWDMQFSDQKLFPNQHLMEPIQIMTTKSSQC